MYSGRGLLFALSAVGMLSGCFFTGNRQALKDAVFEYNHGVRWGRTDRTINHLPPEQRDLFMARREQTADVRIVDMQLGRVRFKDESHAEVTVRFNWYRLGRGKLQRTVMQQTWRRHNRLWHVRDQRWLQGSPMPLFSSKFPPNSKEIGHDG